VRSRESWTNRFRDMPIFHLPCLTIGDIPASCTSTTTPLLKDAQCVDVGYNFAQGMGPPEKHHRENSRIARISAQEANFSIAPRFVYR